MISKSNHEILGGWYILFLGMWHGHTPATLAEGCCGGPEVAIFGVLLFPDMGLAWADVCAPPGLFGMLIVCPPGRIPGTGIAGSLLGSIPGKSA